MRAGALALAVSGIIDGICFDLLFIACSDIACREGFIYRAITTQQVFIIGLTILMTGTLLLGLLKREKYGFAKIGFESLFILLFYIGGVTTLFFTGWENRRKSLLALSKTKYFSSFNYSIVILWILINLSVWRQTASKRLLSYSQIVKLDS